MTFEKEQLMSKRQTVQDPLSANEIFELGVTLFQMMPRTLDATKVRADLTNKSGLGRALGEFLRERYAVRSDFPEAAAWTDFYRRIFGREVDLAGLQVPAKPEHPCWPVVMVQGIANNDAFDACKKQFGKAWSYTDDLNTVRNIVSRPTGAYVVWVKVNVEADPELANISAEEIEKRGQNTLTLRERLVLELKYFDETKSHLDIENWTLCAGSRCAGGGVPGVRWDSGDRELRVDWCRVRDAGSDLRARAASS